MNILLLSFETFTGLPEYFAYIFTFILGAAVGSFLNVVIYRVPKDKSIVFPNSACPNCKESIKPYDNIPIFSWLILSGKCRNCKNSISPRYPAVELLTALVFMLVYWQIGFNAFLPVALIFTGAMISLIFIDAEKMLLPDKITIPLFFFALLVRILFPLFFVSVYFSDLQHYPLNLMQNYPIWVVSVFGGVLGGIAGGGFLWLMGEIWLRLFKIEGMGFGDVKMMFAVGFLLGWRLTLLSIFLGAFIGSIVGIGTAIYKRDLNLKLKIPYGVFLGISAIIALLSGEQIIRWYLETFVP